MRLGHNPGHGRPGWTEIVHSLKNLKTKGSAFGKLTLVFQSLSFPGLLPMWCNPGMLCTYLNKNVWEKKKDEQVENFSISAS